MEFNEMLNEKDKRENSCLLHFEREKIDSEVRSRFLEREGVSSL